MVKVVIVGSFMMDHVCRTKRRPTPGETVIGESFGIFPGGKGFNQAVTARRLGAEVWMVGRLGQDQFGDRFVSLMDEEKIHHDFVARDAEVGTGVSFIVVDASGQNAIVILPQANQRMTTADVDAAADAIAQADVVLLQMEITNEANARAVELARKAGTKIVLNPAPAGPLPCSLEGIDVITPNESEAAILTGLPVDSLESATKAAEALRRMGAAAVVLTLGERGALVVDAEGTFHVPSHEVDVVDTTGAGDAFNGAFAVALASGLPLREAVAFANIAGALAVTRQGAVPSMPNIAEVRAFAAQRNLALPL